MPVHPARFSWTRPLRCFASRAACGWLLLFAASAAWGAEPATTSSSASEVVFLAEVVLLLLIGRLLGEAMQRIGQPAVIGQLVAGILLGPSVFGVIWPEAQHAIFPASGAQKSMIDAVSQLGILMLLLLTGMEIDLRLVRKVGRAAASVSLAGISLPFLCGFALGEFLPDAMLPKPDQRLITSLFLGTALSISSIKIVAMVVREMNFMRRNVGQIIVASAIIDDSIGWIIIAITFGLAEHGAIDLGTLARSVLGTALFLTLSLTVGRRIVSSLIRWTNDNFVGGRLGGLTFRESLALGCGMNARGQTEVIIATIGLSLGMLSHSLFTLIVAMAVVTTTAMPPTLRWALGRLPLGEEERRRLEREESEAKGFVSNMERLLITIDESANGKFASRLAGLIAGSKGMPATVIHAQPADGSAPKQSGHVSSEHAIQVAAEAARVMEAEQESGAPAKVSVITRTGDAPAEETVASEARKGYDLLVIGIENVARNAEFHENVNRIAAEFEGPLAIVAARGIHVERPLQSALNILVP